MTAPHAYVGIKVKPLRALTNPLASTRAGTTPPLREGLAITVGENEAHAGTAREGGDAAAPSAGPFELRQSASVPERAQPVTYHADHRVLTEREWRAVAAHFGLSPRETEVAHRIFDDLREPEIATKLGISPHTVHTHIERLYRKTGVASRSALVITLMAQLRMRLASPSER